MRAKEFFKLLEAKTQEPVQATPGDPASDPLYSLKLAIAHKIKELEPDEQSQHALDEINDVLSTIKIGGRKKATLAGFDEKDMEGKLSWGDKDVQAAKELLARYIVSLEAPVAYKKSMLDQWKNGGLIDTNILFSTDLPKQHTVGEIVKGYDTNPAIKELTTDLLQVSSLGKGKGEFMLKVLSPNITEPSGKKGDIEVIGFGTVEVKTTDGGAGRFTDRQVKPGPGYQSAVNDFFKTFNPFLEEPDASAEQPVAAPAPVAPPAEDPTRLQKLAGINTPTAPAPVQPAPVQPAPMSEAGAKTSKVKEAKPKKMSSNSGINIDQLIELHKKLPDNIRGDFVTKLTAVLDQIFLKVPQYSGAVVHEITAGTSGKAKQLYGVGILNNYMSVKTDEGILYINLPSNPPTFTFFTNNSSLNDAGMRLNIETVYPVTNDIQLAYPKTKIVPTGKAQPDAPTVPTA
jgi:hypothetical protein